MNILLINPPIREDYYPNVIPTGLAIIAAQLMTNYHEVEILDINASRITKDQVTKFFENKLNSFDFVGISGLITTYEYQCWLISEIRRINSKIQIITGGGCSSSVPKLMLSAGADYVVSGEGDLIINSIISWDYRQGIIAAPSVKDLDLLPYPLWSKLDMETYLKNPIWGAGSGNHSNVGIHPDMIQKRSMNVITSRGCSNRCNYCYRIVQNYKQRDYNDVLCEVRYLKDYFSVDFIGFLDDNMMVRKKWIDDFCNAYIDRGLNKSVLWGCHGRVDFADPAILDKMYDAGCRWIGYGIESGSQTILDKMNKGVTVEQSEKAIKMTRDSGIYPNTSFIFGYPGETQETVNETIAFCKRCDIKPKFFHIQAYPGTQLWYDNTDKIVSAYGSEENYIKKLGNANLPVLNLTNWTDEEFFKAATLQDEAIAKTEGGIVQ